MANSPTPFPLPQPAQSSESEASDSDDGRGPPAKKKRLDAFGMKTPTLIEQIKAVLDQYPDDGQILKELIQNAEDAGAKKVRFVNDRRHFPAKSLYNPDLKNFQGPALYAYNDAAFKEADWQRLGAIQNSSKKDDPMKVGKFGLGFKSVFHMTDLPSVMCGDKIGFLDPHERFFGDRTTGKQWHMRKDKREISTLKDQFKPFRDIFRCSGGAFIDRGTVFRFPLRTNEQDCLTNDGEFHSELSEQIYTSEKIETLFKSFMTKSYMNLLFLSSLESIELYERAEEDEEPRLIFRLTIDEGYLETVREERGKFRHEIVKARTTNEWPEKAFHRTYELQFTETNYQFQEPETMSTKWMLTNHFSGGNVSAQFKKLANDSKLGNLPWVAVAMSSETKNSELDCELVKQESQIPKGHLFCFLPLPLEAKSITGLPVHVNGFFALSQNRRHLKWPTADQDESTLTDNALLWNMCLMKEALPMAYAELIQSAIKKCFSPVCVYGALPAYSALDPKFESMVKYMYDVALSRNSFYCPSDTVDNYQICKAQDWEVATRVLFNDLYVEGVGYDDQMTIVKLLLHNGQKVCTVPSHVAEALQKHNVKVTKVQQRHVRAALKRQKSFLDTLPFETKMCLLKYMLSDSQYSDLVGIRLVPLADSSVVEFQHYSSEKEVYIPTKSIHKELLSGLGNALLDTSERVPDTILSQLREIADKGVAQLKILKDESMPRLIGRLFPMSQWKDEQRSWLPETSVHPTHKWLKVLWSYLMEGFPTDLSRFEGLHILPNISSCSIVRLSSGSAALVASWRGNKLSGSLLNHLKTLGVIVFQNLPKYIEDHRAVVPNYIYPPTPEGVLQLLSSVCSQSLLKIKEWPQKEKEQLRNLLFQVSGKSIELHSEVLRSVPIFEYVGGTIPCGQTSMMSLQEVPKALCEVPEFSLPEKFIDASSSSVLLFIDHLNIPRYHMNDLLRETVLTNIEWYIKKGEIDGLMWKVLTVNMNQDESIFKMLKDLPFVPNAYGKRHRARELFDPNDEVVSDLLSVCDVCHDVCDAFPTGQYKNVPILDALKRLGLKSKEQIDANDVFKAAKYIHKHNECGWNCLKIKSEKIMTLLQSQPPIQGLELRSLRKMRFINVKSKPEDYPKSLPWHISQSTFSSPEELKSSIFKNVIGSVEPISDEIVPDREVAVKFGWDRRPTVSKVIDHLEQVVEHYTSKEKDAYLPMIIDIYKELWHPDRAEAEMGPVSSKKWIWNGNGFCRADEIIPSVPLNLQGIQLQPHLYTLPEEIEEFSDKFISCGVKKRDELGLILQLQRIIQRKYQKESEKSHMGCNDTNASHDAERDLQIMIDLLHIVEKMDEDTVSRLKEKLLVPVHTGSDSLLLKPVSQCTYCDADWLQHGYDITDVSDEHLDSIFFVHDRVPMQTSEKLGVHSLMSRVLDAEELDMSYGQSESLSCRLRNLLKDGYTDGFSVPKELVQNADDAGATEVKFLFDQRENEDAQTCLIDEGMKSCQGPALWVYNNAVFTDEDFTNLSKLGGATKEKMTDKIGKFGLGFNAVYNLTDVPSFISKNSIVIFDPHMKYLGKACRSKPGMKINLKNRKKLQKLKNQLKPFDGIFGCNVDPAVGSFTNYDATLFRFPLRTEEQAFSSEISKVHYSEGQVKELLQRLMNGSSELLLFTQNVSKISVHYIPKYQSPSQMQLICETTRNIAKSIRRLDLEVSHLEQTHILKASTEAMYKQIATPRVDKKPTVSFLLEMPFERFSNRALDTESERRSDFWLVTSCMGDLTQEVLGMRSRDDSLVPVGGVAVKLKQCNIQEQIAYVPKEIEGSFFCYLPLPIPNGFAFHVNGSFSVESNRRHLSEKTSDDKVSRGAEWNKILMKDVIPKALLLCLEDLKELTRGTSYTFCKLWPTSSASKPTCEHLTRKIYSTIFSRCQDAPELLSDGGRWKNVHGVGILSEQFIKQNKKIVSQAEGVLNDYLQMKGKLYIQMPSEIVETASLYAPEDVLSGVTYDLCRLYQEAVFPYIHMIDEKDRDILILYALDKDDKDINQFLKKSPCIPSTPYGKLKRPCELLLPNSRAALLYEEEDRKFIQGTENSYRSPLRLLVLEKLGIQTDIEFKDIMERAKGVATIHHADKSRGLERTKQILNYINWRLGSKEKPESTPWEMLCSVPFLPVKQKPEDYPLPWIGNSSNLVEPEKCFTTQVENLVSSTSFVIDSKELGIGKDVEKVLRIQTEKDVELGQVLQQIDEAIKVPSQCESSDKRLNCAVKKIYGYLSKLLRKKPHNLHVHRHITNELMKRNAVYIPEKKIFFPGKKVAFSTTAKYEPLLFEIPSLWWDYRDVMRAAGVREDFEMADYIAALQELHKSPLGKKDHLPVSAQIANSLHQKILENEKGKEKGYESLPTILSRIEKEYGPIYLPNESEEMCEAKHLCYDDCPWLDKDIDTHYVHKVLPYHIAKGLGVQTKIGHKLRKHSRGIGFGQREKLTSRIKRILDGYPCDQDILKELLQNADDAKATEIHFIFDPRKHPTKRIFDDSWKPLQGPALCVYNNSPFTELDIQGIQNLGEGSKSEDPNKTGQYGVGFNAVYHLTDAPCFLTKGKEIGESLCVFDPLCHYVPGASDAEPGRRFDNIPQLRTSFSDVFAGFLDDMGDILPMEEATMFRLPIRNEDMASKSSIKKKAVTVKYMEHLLQKFRDELPLMMLFLNNIQKISVSDINVQTGKLENTFSVLACLYDGDAHKKQSFLERKMISGQKIRTRELKVEELTPIDISYTLTLKIGQKDFEIWLISQQFGFSNPNLSVHLKDALMRRDLGLLPSGGVAYLLKSSQAYKHPLRKMFCFLPLPIDTNLPVHVNGHFALDHEARRQLWGNSDADVKSEWNKTLLEQTVAPCYTSVLQHKSSLITEGVHQMQESDLKQSLDLYAELFPKLDAPTNVYIQHLSKRVYQLTHEKSLRVLPALHFPLEAQEKPSVTWLPPAGSGNDEAYFDDLDNQVPMEFGTSKDEQREKKRPSDIIRKILQASHFKLLHCSLSVSQNYRDTPSVFQNYTAAEIPVKHVSPEAVLQFFQRFQDYDTMCSKLTKELPVAIGQTFFRTAEDLQTLLEYCKKSSNFLSLLEGTPLLLTEEKKLRLFSSKSPVYLSSYSRLLPACSASFCHHLLVHTIFSGYEDKEQLSSVFRPFKINDLAANLQSALPTELRKGGVIQWNPSSRNCTPSQHWIGLLWKYLHSRIDAEIRNQKNNAKAKAKKVLEPLSEWCLLPVIIQPSSRSPDGLYLLQMSQSFEVVERQGYSYELIILEALHKLGVPELAPSTRIPRHIYDHCYDSVHKIIGSLCDPYSVVCALEGIAACCCLEGKLNAKECQTLLYYFSEMVEKKCELRSRLCKFPFFESFTKKLVSICGKTAYILPTTFIPIKGMQMLEKSDERTVFLRPNSVLKPLYELLGCTNLSEVDVYCKFIFPKFAEFSEEDRRQHMKYILRLASRDYDADKNTLMSALSFLKFIPDKRSGIPGSLSAVDAFYDPKIEVFSKMLPVEDFAPEPYNSEKFLVLFRKIGLQQQVTANKLIEFAQNIERDSKTACKDDKQYGKLVNKAKLLSKVLLDENAENYFLMQQIKDIAFLPQRAASIQLQRLCPQDNLKTEEKPPFISFNGAVLYKQENEYMSWTTAAFTEQWANPMQFGHQRTKMSESLGVMEAPSIEQVIEHCCKLCRYLQNDIENTTSETENAQLLSEVMAHIYHHLEKDRKEQLSKGHVPSWISQLQDLACVTVENGTRFVYPSQIATSCLPEEELKPFLYAVPDKYAEYKDLFILIGSTKRPTLEQHAYVLAQIQQNSEGKTLNPNEKRWALASMGFLFKHIKETEDLANDLKVLYLLTTSSQLKMSHQIVFINNTSYHRRLGDSLEEPVLVPLRECEIALADQDQVIKCLPQHLRPKMLTDIVKERLQCHQDDDLSPHPIQLKILSGQFSECVVRLLRHTAKNHGIDIKENDCIHLKDRLKAIRFHTVSKLTIVLEHHGQILIDSSVEKQCFYEFMHDECHIYIRRGARNKDCSYPLTKAINILCKKKLEHVRDILVAVLCKELGTISAFLDEEGILSDDSNEYSGVLPTPGTYLHLDDQHLLSENFDHFECGEYVAYELEDPMLSQKEGLPTYIYAIVLAEIKGEADDSDIMRKYKIKIGSEEDDVIIVSSNDLYKFKRPSTNITQDVVPSDSPTLEANSHLQSPDAIKQDIRTALEAAWKLDEDERKKVIKRLLRKYHPDKNLDQQDISNEACKFIQSEIARLEKGQQQSSASTSYSGSAYRDIFEHFKAHTGSRAKHERECYERQYSYGTFRGRSSSYGSSQARKNPQPSASSRWFCQAQWDFQAVANDINASSKSYEWACFKCHQAAEKALKAAQFAIDANLKDNSHDLPSMAASLGLSNGAEIRRLSAELQVLLTHSVCMRYPDTKISGIPHNVYTLSTATEAKKLTSDLLSQIRETLEGEGVSIIGP